MPLDAATAEREHERLRARGIVVGPGLSLDELAAIESAVGAALPADLFVFWRAGFPVGEYWPAWRADPESQAETDRQWIRGAFAFDIEHGQYWLARWGPRPEVLADALEVAMEDVATWPPLIRIYAHRFMPTRSDGVSPPVLSVWQAVDSVFCGRDLAHYLSAEFDLPIVAHRDDDPAPRVPHWDEAFSLDQSWPPGPPIELTPEDRARLPQWLEEFSARLSSEPTPDRPGRKGDTD